MHVDLKTEEVDLKTLPSEAKIIKWSYLGGYSDSDDIENNSSIKVNCILKWLLLQSIHYLLNIKIGYLKKVAYCNFFEKTKSI